MSQIFGKRFEKWVVLAACIILQSILGGIYAWSSFVQPLTETFGLSRGQCGAIFGLTIAVFTIAMIPAGKFLNRYGASKTALTGSLFFAVGHILASYGNGNFVSLLFGYGLVVGTGIGFGYVCPLTTCMKWFPENRGLVTGIAVAGFGGGAIILSSVAEYLLYVQNYTVLELFRFIGAMFGSTAVIASLFIKDPPIHKSPVERSDNADLFPHLLSRTFVLTFLAMFAGTFSGLLIIGNLKPMMLDFGLGEMHATLAISLFAIGNILGRVIWGQIYDKFGAKNTILLSQILLFTALLLLNAGGSTSLLLTTMLIGAGFGSCFVVYASTIVDRFGVKLFASLYPLCFLGYGLAAIIGPTSGGWLADNTGSFSSSINLSLVIILLSVTMVFLLFESPDDESQAETDLSNDIAQ
ncbi:MAG: hypothetical protein CVV42_06990 [Candidatus Riflebacteria bacterium HGW-Riflebacteria-2]|jgi:OFA family oxalate/formate antiporter-like MFS transporter|nr:MAG: hypothetical protein CVV42_06990 [Candidatus Riflebacteria bacterium HGW-Riflebacteria-2]